MKLNVPPSSWSKHIHWVAPIEVVEIERLQYQGKAVSASWVRQLLVKKDLATIAHLVPEATRKYLQNMLNAQKKSPNSQQESELTTGEK